MNKKILVICGVLLCGLAILGASAFSGAHKQAETKPVIKIGVTLPLTGDEAALGESNRNAILLAASELSSSTKYDYQLVFEDDQFNPAMGASAVNKLIGVDGVSALISFGSPVGNAVSPIAEANHITHINDFASDPHVASGTYNFVDYTPAYQDASLFMKELEKRNIHHAVFFGQQDNPGVTALIADFLRDASGTPGITINAAELFDTGTRDFKTEILEAEQHHPDIYVLEATSPELEILTRQLRELGVTAPVTTMEAFEFSDQLSLFEGMWYVNGADPMPWFLNLYAARYGKDPKFGAANGYDSFNLIVQAAESAGDGKTIPTSAAIEQALSEVKNFNGALGDGLSVGSDHLVISNPVVRMIKNGKPVTIQE